MKRTPIITVGQVYLHTELNEYVTITASHRQMVTYAGLTSNGGRFGGKNDAAIFLKRCQPVDPADLDEAETTILKALLDENTHLSIGWVVQDDDEEFDDYE